MPQMAALSERSQRLDAELQAARSREAQLQEELQVAKRAESALQRTLSKTGGGCREGGAGSRGLQCVCLRACLTDGYPTDGYLTAALPMVGLVACIVIPQCLQPDGLTRPNAAGLTVQHAEAVEALKLAAVQQRLPVVPVPLGLAGGCGWGECLSSY